MVGVHVLMRKKLISLVLVILLSGSPAQAANYYVLPGGTGTFAATSWANANCKIPATLAPGDVVYIGYVSGGNLADTTTPCAGEAYHVFDEDGTSGSHITIRAATAVDHGTETGWSASMGVDVNPKITWSNNPAPGVNTTAFLVFCGDFYDVDGKVGTGDQSGTYGFYFRSPGRMNGFTGTPSLTNLTLTKVEIDGVEADSTNFGATGGAAGIYVGSQSAGVTTSNFTMDHILIRETFTPIYVVGRTYDLTFTNSVLDMNNSNNTQHSNGFNVSGVFGTDAAIRVIIKNNRFKNIMGTGMITCLNGTCDDWKVHNNLFYYTTDWDDICDPGLAPITACSVSKLIGDNVGAGGTNGGVLTNLKFYGNSMINLHTKPGKPAGEFGVTLFDPASITNDVQNNIWYNTETASIRCSGVGSGACSTGVRVTHDYNTWINTSYNATITTLGANENQNGTFASQTAPNPFVNWQAGDFHLASAIASTAAGATLASPFTLDFDGTTRGGDGTWDRGTFEFVDNA